MSEQLLPAGAYWLGDPCYLSTSQDEWDRFVDDLTLQEGDFVLTFLGDSPHLVTDTGGDGVLLDEQEIPYPIDSGLFSISPVTANPPKCIESAANGLGRIINVTNGTPIDIRGSVIYVGPVEIDLNVRAVPLPD